MSYDELRDTGIEFDEEGNYKDFDMSKVNGCEREGKSRKLSWCETHCAKHINCMKVALAEDVITHFLG